MSFNTLPFLIFLAVVFILYYIPPLSRLQTYILIAAGFVFFAYSGTYSLLFLTGSIAFNTLFRFLIVRNDDVRRGRFLIIFAVSVNVILLFALKYTGSVYKLFSGSSTDSFIAAIVLPLGISFYTFQAISMLVDSYRSKSIPMEGIIKNSILYLSFFPNAVSGPLISNSDFSASISAKRISDIQWDRVVKCLIVGYFLKMCIADNIQNQTIYMQYPYFLPYSPIQLTVMMFAYAGQIFADFAGYSLIAKGVALLFGYELPVNFNYPYISKSVGEFWRRWHMSLSEWLKKYVYIPLGGSRKGKARTLFNLFMVMIISGFWHGSDWRYPLWGAIYGVILVLERLLGVGKKERGGFLGLIKIILVFFIVSWLWLFFKLDSAGDVFAYSKAMITNWSIWRSLDADVCFMSVFYCVPLIIYHMIYLYRSRLEQSKIWPYLYYGLYCGMILMIIMNRGPLNAFVYVQF